jgi:hypothetical protein
MLLCRWIINTERGQAEKAAQIVKGVRGQKGSMIAESTRISVSSFGTSDQIAVEFLFRSYAEMEAVTQSVSANPPAWFVEIHPLLKNGDTVESWSIVE